MLGLAGDHAAHLLELAALDVLELPGDALCRLGLLALDLLLQLPLTLAEALGDIYFGLMKAYYGDAYDYDDLARVTWARIPHFYSTPYYVYQYATCFASSAQLMKQLTEGPPRERQLEIVALGHGVYGLRCALLTVEARIDVRPAGQQQTDDQVKREIGVGGHARGGRQHQRDPASALHGINVVARQQHRRLVPRTPARLLEGCTDTDQRRAHR